MTALRAEAIAAALATTRFGRSIDVREETGSTNDDAREALAAGAPDGHVVLADRQRAGRGARGRTWYSPGGTDVYLSIVARVEVAPARLAPLTLAVGLGVARALEAFADGVRIKWPNDVWLDGLKCAGILVEASSRGAHLDGVVIGIGIDVNRVEFAPELAPIATSLRRHLGRAVPREDVVARALNHVEREVDRFVNAGPSAIVPDVLERLALRGAVVTCDDEEGVLLGLTPDGALRLATEQGIRERVVGTLRARGEPRT